MKKALIIYIAVFILTIAVPAIVCFAIKDAQNSSELTDIFRQNFNLLQYYY